MHSLLWTTASRLDHLNDANLVLSKYEGAHRIVGEIIWVDSGNQLDGEQASEPKVDWLEDGEIALITWEKQIFIS